MGLLHSDVIAGLVIVDYVVADVVIAGIIIAYVSVCRGVIANCSYNFDCR